MASFVINSGTTAGQTLDSAEFGFVAPTGSILAPVGSAVVVNATATLISYGAMASSTASGLQLNAVTDTSVTIAASGSVVTGGIDLPAISGTFLGNFALHTSGEVSGGRGISLTSAAGFAQVNVANDGTVQGLGITTGSALALTLNQTSSAVISNTGMMSTAGNGATISATGNGTVTLTNTGNILNASPLQAAIDVAGGLTLRNSGHIEGNIRATQSANIFNSGVISGNITLNSYNDVVRVSGIVMGDVLMGNGVNVFWLTGGRVMGTVCGGAGSDTYHVDRSDTQISDSTGIDTVYASVDFRLTLGLEQLFLSGPRGMVGIGTGLANTIAGDTGDDSLRGLGGDDVLDGGAGNNRIIGGFGNDTLRGGEGDDLLAAGSGNDVVYVGYGNDTMMGGPGRDMLRLDVLTDPGGASVNLAMNKALFADMGRLSFQAFEDVIGTAFGDTLTGNLLANALYGGSGNDMLYGGPGNDLVQGGAGADVMDGGLGADVFAYTAVADSSAAAPDTIANFLTAQDIINLTPIDAVPGGADDRFTFIGGADFTGTAAEVRCERNPGNGTTLIEVRLAGSATDDMRFILMGLYDLDVFNFAL
jgi:Ca2+-binding RTX toxin-like protein